MSGLAAPEKPGRRDLVSAYRVNWLTTSREPPTASRFRFIFSFSSSKMRRPHTLSAILTAWASVSVGATPSSTRKPWPISPLTLPSMVTEAFLTRVTTARIA